jgi:hypothetical protein
MKKGTVLFLMMSLALVIGAAGCSSGGGGGATCAATASCCGGTGYSHDSGTSCYSDAACTLPCTSACVATSSCCGGAGFSNDGGTTCFDSADCANGCGGATTTELKLTNTGTSAVTIGFVTAAYGGACPQGELLPAEELSNAGWCTGYQAGVSGAGKCLVTLGAAGSTTASVFVPNPNNKCMSGSFGTGGFAGCQTSEFPEGWTQGEFTLNPKATTEEAVDISAVNGANYALSINLIDTAWHYEDGSAIVGATVGPSKSLNQNIGIKGVYPNSCTDCIQLVGTIPCAGLAPVPPTCNATRICNVFRDTTFGGTVEFLVGARVD